MERERGREREGESTETQSPVGSAQVNSAQVNKHQQRKLERSLAKIVYEVIKCQLSLSLNKNIQISTANTENKGSCSQWQGLQNLYRLCNKAGQKTDAWKSKQSMTRAVSSTAGPWGHKETTRSLRRLVAFKITATPTCTYPDVLTSLYSLHEYLSSCTDRWVCKQQRSSHVSESLSENRHGSRNTRMFGSPLRHKGVHTRGRLKIIVFAVDF